MKKFAQSAILSAVLLIGSAAARASLTAYEGFNYSAGSTVVGQSGGFGFADNWQVDTNYTTASGSLTSPTAPIFTSGNSLEHASLAQGHVLRTLSTTLGTAGTTVYMSFILEPQGTLGQGVSNGYFGVALAGTGTQVFIGKPGSGAAADYDMENQGGTGVASSTVAPVVGQPVFMVLRADFTAGLDTLSLYINPGSTQPAIADAIKSDVDLGTISVLGIDSGGQFAADEIRIGTSYADVTPAPEPLSASLLILGFGYSLCTRRRAR